MKNYLENSTNKKNMDYLVENTKYSNVFYIVLAFLCLMLIRIYALNVVGNVIVATSHVVVAGCQIHYAIKCENKPNTDVSEGWTTNDNGIQKYERPTTIYVAE